MSSSAKEHGNQGPVGERVPHSKRMRVRHGLGKVFLKRSVENKRPLKLADLVKAYILPLFMLAVAVFCVYRVRSDVVFNLDLLGTVALGVAAFVQLGQFLLHEWERNAEDRKARTWSSAISWLAVLVGSAALFISSAGWFPSR